MSYDIVEHSRQIQQLLESEVPFVVVTLIDIRGKRTTSRRGQGDYHCGWYRRRHGGGKIEAGAIAHAQQLLRQAGRLNDWVTWNLQTDIGMTPAVAK
ncbi:MAG: hypothetical protein R3C56_08460 [Pirellulaceae bacterium]